MSRAPLRPQATLLDVCCCAGLGADGYESAGVRIGRGVDLFEQPHYPYPFTQADGLEVLGGRPFLRHVVDPDAFDALHTSWPCQPFTRARHLRDAQGGKARFGVDLLTPGLALLRERWAHKAWIVENVPSREVTAIMAPRAGEYLTTLCGSMFGLDVQRHRHFLTNFPVVPLPCRHERFPLDPISGKPRPWGVYHVAADSVPAGGRTARDAEHGRHVMGSRRLLPWDALKEGFPPAYTAYIGAHLLVHLTTKGSA